MINLHIHFSTLRFFTTKTGRMHFYRTLVWICMSLSFRENNFCSTTFLSKRSNWSKIQLKFASVYQLQRRNLHNAKGWKFVAMRSSEQQTNAWKCQVFNLCTFSDDHKISNLSYLKNVLYLLNKYFTRRFFRPFEWIGEMIMKCLENSNLKYERPVYCSVFCDIHQKDTNNELPYEPFV